MSEMTRSQEKGSSCLGQAESLVKRRVSELTNLKVFHLVVHKMVSLMATHGFNFDGVGELMPPPVGLLPIRRGE